jgi:D-alanyl-D-alanine carboxypeptidase
MNKIASTGLGCLLLSPALAVAQNPDVCSKRVREELEALSLTWNFIGFTRQCFAFVFFVTIFCFAQTHCFAQTQFPDTSLGHQTAAWLQAFNSDDRKKLQDFFLRNLPVQAERMDQQMLFRAATGGFDLKKIEASTSTKLTALLQERRSDQMARLTIEVDEAEPHRLTNLDVGAIPRPAEFALPRLSESELIAALRKKLDEDSAADYFSGAVLVASPSSLRRTAWPTASTRSRTL